MFDTKMIPIIEQLVKDIASCKYAEIQSDGRIGRLTASELEEAIKEYGRTIIPLPSEGLKLIDACKVDGTQGEWMVDVPMWTKEEGRSDLTLSATVVLTKDGAEITMDDFHVL